MVNPGLVDTKLLKDTMDEETQSFLLENIVLGGRLIEPFEIADVIYFCATTPCINGAVIDANLGQAAD
jgi:NADP-dependent 3-hydroxy acid dehydrogenase YdfG